MKCKAVAILCLILISSTLAFSQKRNRFIFYSSETQFSAGPELVAVLPSGAGIGVSLQYEQPLKLIPNMTVTATAGLIGYGYSTTYVNAFGSYTARTSALFFPLLGGAKYYYPGPLLRGLYGSLEAGLGIGSSPSVTYSGTTSGPERPAALTNVMVAPGIGYQMGSFDFALRYYSVGMVSLRGAYIFKLK